MLGARTRALRSGRPIDIRLGDGYTALLITGPNTGGKTVDASNAGPSELDAPVRPAHPADVGTKLPILHDIYAEHRRRAVGRAIALDFSGHLRSIVRIVESPGRTD